MICDHIVSLGNLDSVAFLARSVTKDIDRSPEYSQLSTYSQSRKSDNDTAL